MNNTKEHQQLVDDLLFEVSKAIGPFGRIFPRRIGLAVPIGRKKPIMFGIKGEPDLQGWLRVNREGSFYALAFAIECKTGAGELTKDQRNWRCVFQQCGGLFIEGRSVDQVLHELRPFSGK